MAICSRSPSSVQFLKTTNLLSVSIESPDLETEMLTMLVGGEGGGRADWERLSYYQHVIIPPEHGVGAGNHQGGFCLSLHFPREVVMCSGC